MNFKSSSMHGLKTFLLLAFLYIIDGRHIARGFISPSVIPSTLRRVHADGYISPDLSSSDLAGRRRSPGALTGKGRRKITTLATSISTPLTPSYDPSCLQEERDRNQEESEEGMSSPHTQFVVFPSDASSSHPLRRRSIRSSFAHFVERVKEAFQKPKQIQEQGPLVISNEGKDRSSTQTLRNEDKPRIWKRLKSICKPERPLLFVSALALLAAALVEVSVPHYSSQALSAILLRKGRPVFLNEVRTVVQLGILAAVTTGIRGLCFGLAGTRIVCRLRHELFRSLLKQDIAFFDQNQSGELTNRLTADCSKISNVVSLNVNIMVRQTIQLLGGMVYLYRLHRQIAAVAGVGLAIIFFITGLHGKYNRVMGEKIQNALASSNAAAGNSLSLIRVVRTHVGESVELGRYDRELTKTVNMMEAHDFGYGVYRLLIRIAQTGLLGAVLCLGYHLTNVGAMSMEQLTSALFYVNFVMGASYDVGDQYTRIQDALGSATQVFALLDRKPAMSIKPLLSEPKSYSEQVSPPASSHAPPQGTSQEAYHLLSRPTLDFLAPPLGEGTGGEVVFSNVSFAYPLRCYTPILQNLDLTIRPGQRVAIVGASGGGKSTLLRLLSRLYDPDHGHVYLDGRDIGSMSQEELTSKVAMLSQEPPLLPISIADNIAYGLKQGSYTKEDIESAARAANVHNFIMSLPDQYDTQVGEGSVALSGGQKQRVAIARALIRKPRVLLLDEPTSALDAESERVVQEALDLASKGRTVLIVAHRLATIESADFIVVLKEGKVEEMGTHQELLAKNGLYASLRTQQLTGHAAAAEGVAAAH